MFQCAFKVSAVGTEPHSLLKQATTDKSHTSTSHINPQKRRRNISSKNMYFPHTEAACLYGAHGE